MKKMTFAAFFLAALFSGCTQRAVVQDRNQSDPTLVEMVTSKGRMVLKLYDDTPQHRDNFLKLVNNGAYDSLLFHRVIAGFMIQGGDPMSRNARPGQMLGDGDLGYTVPAEFRTNHIHRKGALCAARQGDQVNPAKASSATQFYVVQGKVWSNEELDMMQARFGKPIDSASRAAYTTEGGAPHLDGDYTVFGEVVEGLDVVDSIAAAKTDRFDRPLEDIRIMSAKVIKK